MPALIALAYLSLLALGLMDNMRGPFFPEIIADLQLNATEAASFYGITSLSAFFGSFMSHRLMKGRDVLNVMTLISVVFTLGYAGVSQSHEYIFLLAFCAIFGWAYGFLNVLQNVLVSEAAPKSKRRRLLNGLQGMYGLAAFLAPVMATVMRDVGFTWRMTFLLLAALPLIVAAMSWWKRGVHLYAHDAPPAERLNSKEWRLCAAMAVVMSVYLWGELSASTRLVLWLRTERGFAPDAADFQLGIFFLGMLTGRLTFSFLSFEKLNNWTILMLSAVLSSVIYLAGLHYSPWLLALSGLAFAPFFPVMMDEAAMSFRNKAPQALGVIIGVGNLSIMSMHMAVGVLTASFGLTAALHVGPIAMAIVFVLLAGLKYYR